MEILGERGWHGSRNVGIRSLERVNISKRGKGGEDCQEEMKGGESVDEKNNKEMVRDQKEG